MTTAIILAGGDDERFWSALSLACTMAAREEPVRLFLSGAAAMLAGEDYEAAGDAERSQVGVPTVAELMDSALDLGVAISVCQTGMALLGLEAADLREDVRPEGLLSFLDDDDGTQRLLTF